MSRSTAVPRPSDRFIPLYIVAFFVVISGVLGTFVYVAMTTYRGVVTDHAYEKGVNYNAVIEKAAAQQSLGYSHALSYENDDVFFVLNDKNGAAVAPSRVRVWFFRPTQAGLDQQADMTRQSDGRYAASVAALPVKGVWDVRVYAQTPEGDYQASKRITVQ